MTTERQHIAYSVFRGGFRDGHPNAPPHWDDLEPWMRDAIKVAYLQGTLDGIAPAPLLASASPESPGLAGRNAGQGQQYGPHRCYFPHKGGGEVLVTIEHEIGEIDRACGYR